MQQRYQDAMAMLSRFGNLDIFLTFTTNPSWPEITNNLRDGQNYKDSPDLLARVYRLKQKELLRDIWEAGVLGKVL